MAFTTTRSNLTTSISIYENHISRPGIGNNKF